MTEKEILKLPEAEFIDYVLQGNRDAIDFCNLLFSVSQVWDDLIDRDKSTGPVAINRAFWTLLVSLPGNRFYQDNYNELHPLIRRSIFDWWDANQIEIDQKRDLAEVAYGLRSSISNILVDVTYIVGGYEWVNKMSLLIRKRIYTDNIQDYIKETFDARSNQTNRE